MKKLNIWLFIFLLPLCSFTFARDESLNRDSSGYSQKSFLGISLEGLRISENKLENSADETGITLNFVNLFLQWPKNPNNGYFPLHAMEEIWDCGAVPVITWEPMYIDDGEEHYISYRDILDGKYDKYLSYVIGEIQKFNKPVIIRFAHEMNLSKYHWTVPPDKYNDSYPAIYKTVYRYIHSKFRLSGTGNILWAFCPNCDSVPNYKWNNIESYYPGDSFVDIMGVDGYNWGDNKMRDYQSTWRSFDNIFSSSIQEIKKINSKKPLFIFETASSFKGGDRAVWIDKALYNLEKNDITCMMWFHIDKEEKWKISPQEKYIFEKNIQRENAQKWAWSMINEKIKSFKGTR